MVALHLSDISAIVHLFPSKLDVSTLLNSAAKNLKELKINSHTPVLQNHSSLCSNELREVKNKTHTANIPV